MFLTNTSSWTLSSRSLEFVNVFTESLISFFLFSSAPQKGHPYGWGLNLYLSAHRQAWKSKFQAIRSSLIRIRHCKPLLLRWEPPLFSNRYCKSWNSKSSGNCIHETIGKTILCLWFDICFLLPRMLKSSKCFSFPSAMIHVCVSDCPLHIPYLDG